MNLLQSKKGLTLSQAPGAIITFGLLIIISAVVALVLSNINTSFTSGTYEANITTKGLQGVNNFATFNPTIGTILAAALIIGIVVTAFGVFAARRG